MNDNDASRPKNSKQAKSGPKQKFHDQNAMESSLYVNVVSITWIAYAYAYAMWTLFFMPYSLSNMVL